MKNPLIAMALATLVGVYLIATTQTSNVPTPTVEHGARVFRERCVLCHGNDGMGGGLLPLVIKGYTNTNLVDAKFAQDLTGIRQAIVEGNGHGKMLSRPWGDELMPSEVTSVALFIEHLRAHPADAIKMIKAAASNFAPSLALGSRIYETRCRQCHGYSGEGDGRLAAVITNPPPFDLTESQASDTYLGKFIRKGGAAMGRSPQMPPWDDDLTRLEIESVILYIKNLRK